MRCFSRRLHLAKILSAALSIGAGAMLSACDFTAPAAIPTKVIVIPTSTLAPILTATPRLTATPIPTDTLIPSPTLLASYTPLSATATFTPSASPTSVVVAVVRADSGDVNLRTGPGTAFKKIGMLLASSQIQVLFTSTDTKWTLVQLEDGSQGWVLSSLITYLNPLSTVPALTTPQLTQQAQLNTAISLTQAALAPVAPAVALTPIGGATHVPRIDQSTDVLAYCDNPNVNATQNRKFAAGSSVVIFWSWIAKTPEQIKDQLDNAQYAVTVDGRLIGEWQNYASPVIARKSGDYIVYWFVPLGKPDFGTHHIIYKLTWKQPISDGTNNFGAGTDNPANTGSCSFTIAAK